MCSQENDGSQLSLRTKPENKRKGLKITSISVKNPRKIPASPQTQSEKRRKLFVLELKILSEDVWVSLKRNKMTNNDSGSA